MLVKLIGCMSVFEIELVAVRECLQNVLPLNRSLCQVIAIDFEKACPFLISKICCFSSVPVSIKKSLWIFLKNPESRRVFALVSRRDLYD